MVNTNPTHSCNKRIENPNIYWNAYWTETMASSIKKKVMNLQANRFGGNKPSLWFFRWYCVGMD